MERAPPEGDRESCAPPEWRGPMSIIMRATLHDPAPNTYYGRWPGAKAAVAGLESPAIAHNELTARAGFVAFDNPERDFPGNRSAPRWKFAFRPQRKIGALRSRICHPDEKLRDASGPEKVPRFARDETVA